MVFAFFKISKNFADIQYKCNKRSGASGLKVSNAVLCWWYAVITTLLFIGLTLRQEEKNMTSIKMVLKCNEHNP